MGKYSRPTKVSLKSLASDNGKKPGKPSLAGLKTKPLPKKQTKQDFYAGGLLYWDATITGEASKGMHDGVTRPIGTVSVSNGDQTYVFHNRYGSWMADVGAMMAEPARVANLLGTNMGQIEMYQNIKDRFEAELKVKGILTTEQQRAAVEEQKAVQRSRTTAAKKRAATNQANPWIAKTK